VNLRTFQDNVLILIRRGPFSKVIIQQEVSKKCFYLMNVADI